MSDLKTLETCDLNDLITSWKEAQTKAAYWAAQELEMRRALFNRNFKDPKPGTNKVRIDFGMALVGDYKLNYKVDRPLLEELSKEPVTAGIIAGFITYEPKVSGSKFRALDVDSRNLVAAMVTETPGTPSLEVKPAKELRW